MHLALAQPLARMQRQVDYGVYARSPPGNMEHCILSVTESAVPYAVCVCRCTQQEVINTHRASLEPGDQ
jgi:hypothetical protein